MAAQVRMEGAPVELRALERALRTEPTSFSFFQAVRLLERLRPDRNPVGSYGDPNEEVVRFSATPSIAFPPSEIAALEQLPDGSARMRLNFIGLIGPQGVLPYHYTILAAERQRARDEAYAAFLDIFNHRIASLFYRAWAKHHFVLGYERGEDRMRAHLLDLVGAGLETARKHLPISEEALMHYAGLFTGQARSAATLQQLIEDFFGVPAEIEQFVGDWYPLPRQDQCALGEDLDVATQLGAGAVVGDEVWDQQTRVRIRLGPLNATQFDEFLPTGSAYASLRALTRFFSHDQYEFELQLVLARDDVPGFVLGGDEARPQPLGWSTWIRTREFAADADDIFLTL
jgi:type VI secretion system protein ImpH